MKKVLIVLLTLVMLASGLSLNAFAATQTLTVMSFNVRVDLIKNGRDKLVIETIKENAPDVFGVQEADITWMNKLKSGLSGYAAIGKGRDLWGAGEHCAIFYRTDKFKAIASDTRWLSSTPTKESTYSFKEGGKTYKANEKRIMTYVVLERKSDGARFLVVNAHLDNNGNNTLAIAEKIRKAEVDILMKEVKGILKVRGNIPTIILGDFNATPEKTAYKTMTGTYGYSDSSKVAASGSASSTYNGMTAGTSAILDYIFVSSNIKGAVQSYKVCAAKRNGQWVSDHNAIVVKIALPKE